MIQACELDTGRLEQKALHSAGLLLEVVKYVIICRYFVHESNN